MYTENFFDWDKKNFGSDKNFCYLDSNQTFCCPNQTDFSVCILQKSNFKILSQHLKSKIAQCGLL